MTNNENNDAADTQENEPSGVELRQERRSTAKLFVCVHGGDEDRTLGALADISTRGFKLSSEKQIETGVDYELKIENPYELKANSFGSFTAKALWSKQVSDGFFDTGFEFVSLSVEAQALFPNLEKAFNEG